MTGNFSGVSPGMDIHKQCRLPFTRLTYDLPRVTNAIHCIICTQYSATRSLQTERTIDAVPSCIKMAMLCKQSVREKGGGGNDPYADPWSPH